MYFLSKLFKALVLPNAQIVIFARQTSLYKHPKMLLELAKSLIFGVSVLLYSCVKEFYKTHSCKNLMEVYYHGIQDF